ncbi:MAG: response regulator transcription factor [Verrucomicrobiales bacterium]|nr:response regulator transcription factor [Verrucomicrobiales bacterium]
MNIRVAIVEDTASVREGLAAILNGTPGFQCVCACGTAEEALRRIRRDETDVVLMDINLPGRSGVECVQRLKERDPGLQIVMLTIEADSQRVFDSLAAGATGYLVKNVPPAGILAAIEEVHRGGSPMSSQIARMLVQSFHRQGRVAREDENLTAREEEILSLIARGYRGKEVAQALGIATATVETHLRNIYDKFHVRSRAGAVAKFLGRQK